MGRENYTFNLTKEEQQLLYSSVEYYLETHKEYKELCHRILYELDFSGIYR